jgi:hypothetical protein
MNLVEHDGRPRWVEIAPGESLRAALAAVPDEDLVAAFEREWRSRGLTPPRRTAGGLRRRILAYWRRKAALELTDERRVPISEAARELGIPERTLRDQIGEGKLPGASVSQRGLLTLNLPRNQPRQYTLIPRGMGPDPRIVMQMREKGVEPGASYSWRTIGDDAEQIYTRRADGANWASPKGAP